MLHEFISLFSQVCGVYGIVVFSMFGFIFIDKKVFEYCIYLMMITMIYNTVLKNIFQMPLPETCPTTGFGFPSGHSHFGSIFYLWVIAHYKNNILRVFCLLMMAFSWYTMVYLGFHYPFDVCFASVFALISVVLYRYFVESRGDLHKVSLFSTLIAILYATETKTLLEPRSSMIKIAVLLILYAVLAWMLVYERDKCDKKTKIIFNVVGVVLLATVLCFRASVFSLQPHIYIAFYFIIGLYLGNILFNEDVKTGIQGKIVAMVIIFCLYHIFKYLFDFVSPDYQAIKQLLWFCLAFSMHLSIRISNAIIRR